jgi:hypothetical protein
MVVRIAASMALVAFALCIVVGGLETGNPFGTTIQRALVALVATLFIGLIIGSAFKIMLRENLAMEEKKLKNAPVAPASTDR